MNSYYGTDRIALLTVANVREIKIGYGFAYAHTNHNRDWSVALGEVRSGRRFRNGRAVPGWKKVKGGRIVRKTRVP